MRYDNACDCRKSAGKHQPDDGQQRRDHESVTAVLMRVEHNQTAGVGCQARQHEKDP
jgi:hypothetical protein